MGAFAAIAQQAPIAPTRDIELTPETSSANLARSSSALDEHDARIRTEAVPGGLPFDHGAASLMRAETWDLVCRFGEFDISFHPGGFPEGYPHWPAVPTSARRCRGVDVDDLVDVMRSKKAAGRPKDVRVHPSPLQTSGDPEPGSPEVV